MSDLYFLGPKAEQRKVFTELIDLVNNDYLFWRRNFCPRDPPTIAYKNLQGEEAKQLTETLMQNLIQLLGDLKLDIPFFSPRYIAHMASEISIPALVAHYAGTLYHANNVSLESAPVTLYFEKKAIEDFLELFEWKKETSFGNITSGGTVANYQSCFYHLSARFLPVSLFLYFKEHQLAWPKDLPTSLWELSNVPFANLSFYLERCQITSETFEKLKSYFWSSLGAMDFKEKVEKNFQEKFLSPCLIAPSNAHYSWNKSLHLFGLGTSNLFLVPMSSQLAMDVGSLKERLDLCLQEKRPIIQLVCVMGATEFGSFDPLSEVFSLLEEYKKKGLYTPVHIDAAYGGYFKTLEKSSEIYKKMCEVTKADSLTIDPHKLGLTPYGAGVFLTKHSFLKNFVFQKAEYCLNAQEQNFSVGPYILEGSKSGAMATCVYFSHKIIPLDSSGYGRHLGKLLTIAAHLYDSLQTLSVELEKTLSVKICFLSRPQSNVLNFYMRPLKEKKISQLNSLTEKVLENFYPQENNQDNNQENNNQNEKKIKDYAFFVSKTKIMLNKFTSKALEEMTLSSFEFDEKEVLVFRIVLLNPWFLEKTAQGISYEEEFLQHIKRILTQNSHS